MKITIDKDGYRKYRELPDDATIEQISNAVQVISNSISESVDNDRKRKEKQANCKHDFEFSGGKWTPVWQQTCIKCGLIK
jgi:hypothetical protein